MNTALNAALDSIVSSLRDLGHPSVDRLLPPLTPAERSQLWSRLPFPPTRELDDLYAWRNGVDAPAGALLDGLQMIPGFHFLSLEEAVAIYFEREDGPQWQVGWFAFMADGAGDFYISPCPDPPAPQSSVVGFIHGEPEQPVEYQSITVMMATFAHAYAQRAVYTDAHRSLDYDDDAFRRIAHAFNPGILVWQD